MREIKHGDDDDDDPPMFTLKFSPIVMWTARLIATFSF